VIVRRQGKNFKVKYRVRNGEVTFDEEEKWEQVEHEFVAVGSRVLFSGASTFIRAVDDSPGRYRAHAVLFGSPETKDLDGYYFTPDTEYHLDWFTERPWLYHHGLHPQLGGVKVGTWDDIGVDEAGVFVEGELKLAGAYREAVETLLEAEVLKPSTGTLNYMAKAADDGRFIEWPIVEISSTVVPAEARMLPITPAVMSAMKALEPLESSKGGTKMSIGDAVKEFVEQLMATKAASPAASEPEAGTEGTPAESTEGESEVADTEENEVEVTTAEVAVELAKALKFDQVIKAIGALDVGVKSVSDRLAALEGVVQGMAASESEKVKSLLEGDDWYKSLFVASKQADVMPEKAASSVAAKNQTPTTPSEGQGVFGRITGGQA